MENIGCAALAKALSVGTEAEGSGLAPPKAPFLPCEKKIVFEKGVRSNV